MNPESMSEQSVEHTSANVVNPEIMQTTPLQEVENKGGMVGGAEDMIMPHQENKQVVHQEKVTEVRKSIFAKFKEGLFGNKEEDFTKDMKTKIKAWANQGAIEDPSDSDIATIMEQARADKFEGKVGNQNNKLVYRKSSEIKWGTSSHSFGSGE